MPDKRSRRPRARPWHETEKREILAALKKTFDDPVLAAWLLGIGRTTLYRKLKSYGVNGSSGITADERPRPAAKENRDRNHARS